MLGSPLIYVDKFFSSESKISRKSDKIPPGELILFNLSLFFDKIEFNIKSE